MNDFPNDAVSVAEGEYVIGALDNTLDQDFFSYAVPTGKVKLIYTLNYKAGKLC